MCETIRTNDELTACVDSWRLTNRYAMARASATACGRAGRIRTCSPILRRCAARGRGHRHDQAGGPTARRALLDLDRSGTGDRHRREQYPPHVFPHDAHHDLKSSKQHAALCFHICRSAGTLRPFRSLFGGTCWHSKATSHVTLAIVRLTPPPRVFEKCGLQPREPESRRPTA